MKKIAIIQPSYIPWKGYFDMIQKSEVFVFLDDVQYSKNTWRNRNKIKAPNGTIWLTIPVHYQSLHTNICDISIVTTSNWQKKHLRAITLNYAKASYYEVYVEKIKAILFEKRFETISKLDIHATIELAKLLNIHDTEFLISSELHCSGIKSEKVLNICKQVGANHYITGPSGMNYLDIDTFKENGINIKVQHYVYPEYQQLYGKFEHEVSIIDMLFNLGPETPKYIWHTD